MSFFQPELGWSVWGSLGWTKTADGLNWRMLDHIYIYDALFSTGTGLERVGVVGLDQDR